MFKKNSVICPHCRWIGAIEIGDGKWRTCPLCEGRGEITREELEKRRLEW